LITGEQVAPGQKLIGLASSGIHSNGLSLARKLFKTEEEQLALLEPTRIYVKPIVDLFKTHPQVITGICHVTGGGWRNLFRLNPGVGFEISDPVPVLPIFERLMTYGVSVGEAYKTFNMGMGLVLMVKDSAEAIVGQLNAAGFEAKVVGEVTDVAGELRVPTQGVHLINESRKGRDV
jgi:phosphoribosylformylglycinamidine cyclo-ligase